MTQDIAKIRIRKPQGTKIEMACPSCGFVSVLVRYNQPWCALIRCAKCGKVSRTDHIGRAVAGEDRR